MTSNNAMNNIEYLALSEAEVKTEPGYSKSSSPVQPQTPRSEMVPPQEVFESQFQCSVPPLQPYDYPMGSIPQQQQCDNPPPQKIPTGHALQDYQMQLMLLEQQNKKRLMMARQESESNHLPQQEMSTTPAQQDYQMQLMLLEQQGKERVMMAREEADRNKSFEQAQRQGEHAGQDYQMQLMLLEQQNKKQVMMARQELLQQEMSTAPVPAQQEYEMQLMLLEQQNKKRLMMARQHPTNKTVEQAQRQGPQNMNPSRCIPSVDSEKQDACQIRKAQEPQKPQLWIDWEVQAKSHLGLAPNAIPSHAEQAMLDSMVKQKYDQVWGGQEKQGSVQNEAAPAVIKTYQEQLRAQALMKAQQAQQLRSQALAKQADWFPNNSAARQENQFKLNLRDEQDLGWFAGIAQTERSPTLEVDPLMLLNQQRKKRSMMARQPPPANDSEQRGRKRAMIPPMGQPQQCTRLKLDETSNKTTAKETAPQCYSNPVQTQEPSNYKATTAAEALAHRQALPPHALQDYQLQLMLLEQHKKKQGKEVESSPSLEGTREGDFKTSQGPGHPQRTGGAPFNPGFNQNPSGDGQATYYNSSMPAFTARDYNPIWQQSTNPTWGCKACRPAYSLAAHAQEFQRVQHSQPSNNTKTAVIDLTKEDEPAPKQHMNESTENIPTEDPSMLKAGGWQDNMHGQDAGSPDSEWSRLSTPEGTPETDGFVFIERHGPLAIRPAPERTS